MTQIEAVIEAISQAESEGRYPSALRMQSATRWKNEDELRSVLFIKIIEDETTPKNVIQIEW